MARTSDVARSVRGMVHLVRVDRTSYRVFCEHTGENLGRVSFQGDHRWWSAAPVGSSVAALFMHQWQAIKYLLKEAGVPLAPLGAYLPDASWLHAYRTELRTGGLKKGSGEERGQVGGDD